MKSSVLVTVSVNVVTVIGPLAPLPTVARRSSSSRMVKLAASVPPKLTSDVQEKEAPVMNTVVSLGPLVGEKPVMVSVGI